LFIQKNSIEKAKREGLEKGRKEGIEKGREEGKLERNMEIAKKL